MMKQLLNILSLILIFLILAACTRNNGDIGDYFGEWRLEKLIADGEEEALYTSDSDVILYTWAFHGKVFQISTVHPRHDVTKVVGSWRQDGDMLELNFSYNDDNPDNIGFYRPPEALHLVSGGITRLHIDRFKDRRMVLTYISDEGITYVYYLKRPV